MDSEDEREVSTTSLPDDGDVLLTVVGGAELVHRTGCVMVVRAKVADDQFTAIRARVIS